MSLSEVMAALEAAGTEQTRKTYRRHGAKDPMFGVNFAVLGQLARKIKVDHSLAQELWLSGNADARNLATMIADPQVVTSSELDGWVGDSGRTGFTGLLSRNLVLRSPHAREKFFAWVESSHEGTAEAGWLILASGADRKDLFSDHDLLALVPRIEAEIHSAANWVKAAMNLALIAIGMRNPLCEKAAVAAAKRVGKVHVDQGDTNCKTPDAVEYIAKGMAHRAAKAISGKGKRAGVRPAGPNARKNLRSQAFEDKLSKRTKRPT